MLRDILMKIVRAYWGRHLTRVKLQGAIYYAEGVRGVRSFCLLLCLAGACVVLITFGLLLIPVALCLYMPWTPEVKAGVALLFGVGYALGALAFLAALFSESRWMRMSGAKALLARVVKEL
jgi:hypothetical protein